MGDRYLVKLFDDYMRISDDEEKSTRIILEWTQMGILILQLTLESKDRYQYRTY